MELSFTQDKFLQLLTQFQSAIDSGEYTEKIPYDTWRKLKKLYEPKIEFTSPFVRVFGTVIDTNGATREAMVFSAKTYDNGFGRFFRNYVIKEREKMGHETVSNAASTIKADNTTYAYTKADNSDTCIGKICNTVDSTSLTWDGSSWGTAIPSINTPYDVDSTGGWTNISTITNLDGIQGQIDKLEKELQKKVDKSEMKNNKKESDSMIKGINFDFGPCGNTVRLSMYGMAIQNVAGEWVSYNPESREIINVDVFNMADGGKYMYKMPVAISDVAVGDIVIHNRVPMFVTAINENGTFEVTDVRAGEAKTVIPTRNMFGFNFMTKVVSLFSAFTNAPTADQPFGNMLPFLMLNDENKDIDPMMFLFMMNQGGATNMFSNPMMMYFLMKDNKDIDPMMLMFMMGQGHTYNCNKPAAVTPATQG